MSEEQDGSGILRRLNSTNVVAGGLLVLIAAGGLVLNHQYQLGTAASMGPGYMPMLVFILLGLLGATIAGTGLRPGNDPVQPWAWRQLALVLGAMAAFGLLIDFAGMGISVAVVVIISSLADRSQTARGVLVLTMVLVAMSWLIFSVGLRLNVPFLPPIAFAR